MLCCVVCKIYNFSNSLELDFFFASLLSLLRIELIFLIFLSHYTIFISVFFHSLFALFALNGFVIRCVVVVGLTQLMS